MKTGFMVKPKLTEREIDDLMKLAYKNGRAEILAITPHNQSARLAVRVQRTKGFDRVEVDTHSSNWNISEAGQKSFMLMAKDWPEDIKDPGCSRCVMKIYVKHDGERMWGAGLWLTRMLEVLKSGEHLEEVKSS